MASTFLDFNDKDILEFIKDLRVFAKKQYPKINGIVLNQAAFKTRKLAQRTIRRRFTLRNKWTERSIQVQMVRGFNPRTQESRVGSRMDYMRDQETGTTIQKTGKHGVAIPTSTASGEGMKSKPRKRTVRRANLRSSIQLKNRRIKARSKKQYIFLAIRQAAARAGRNKFLYLPFNRHPGIYKITGKKRATKLRLVWDFSRPSIHLQRRPWLRPVTDRIERQLPDMYIKTAKKVLKI